MHTKPDLSFTAEEARKLSGESVEEKVAKILTAIKAEALNRKRELKTGWQYKLDSDLWVNGGYSQTEDWKAAKKILEHLGFTVEFFYQENQFVDMYTVIKW